MGIVTFQIKEGSPNSYHLPQTEVMAVHPKTNQLKHIGYFRGQNSIFLEDINNKDLKPSKVPDFVFNPERNKCELRFNDKDTALMSYIESHPFFINGVYERYSEEIENYKNLEKAEYIEEALSYVNESDDLKIQALGLSVLGIDEAYKKTPGTIKSLLKTKSISDPKQIINAYKDELFENKFIASLALCSGIVETNNTMTAIVWGDNKGRLINIATGEDFITKFAKHLSEKSPESQALLQELGTRLELSKKAKSNQNKEADEIAELKAKLANAEMEREIAEKKLAGAIKSEPTLEELALLELREKYKEVVGNVPPRYQNDAEWLQSKIDEKDN